MNLRFSKKRDGRRRHMNILHMKYAVEVARLGSLNKAAESLIIAQPNISRSIKELESDLGISLFTRSAKGMVLTPEGAEFINYAQGILKQIDEVELLYKSGAPRKQKLSISVPHACYISNAFAEFSKMLTEDPAEICYRETSTQQTINDVLSNDYKLGIIRYPESCDKQFKAYLDEKGLAYEMVAEFSNVLIMNPSSPLAKKEKITSDDLASLIEISPDDPHASSPLFAKIEKEERPDNVNRKIILSDRAGQFDLLTKNPQTYLWSSPISQELLDHRGLTQRPYTDNPRRYKDVLIYRNGYKLTKLDKQFITSLCEAKRIHFK